MKNFVKIFLIILFMIFITACSSKVSETSTKTTTSMSSPAYEADSSTAKYNQQETVITETVVKEEKSSGFCDGILSCTFGVLGKIIALPFILVAELIDFIF